MHDRTGNDHDGRLVESFERPGGRTGLLYLKGVELGLRAKTFDRPALYFPRANSRMRVATPQGEVDVTPDQVLMVPAGCRHEVRARASVLELAILLPDPSVISEVATSYEQPPREVERVFAELFVAARPRWLDECQHRYVFERVVCEREGNTATLFLETEIVKEFYFVRVQSKDERGCFPPLFDVDSPARRAMAFIEQHLFEDIALRVLAERAGASRSTLLRSFRKEFGMSPQQYVRDRRLDQAMTMLSRPGHSVGEVAAIVGYDSLSAFSQAFRRKFGRTPTGVARK